MNKLLFLVFIFAFACSVYASESITNLTVTNPVPLDTKLIATGIYTNSAISVPVFCKFIVLDPDRNYFVVERYTDELTFTDGTFYTERNITEPKYFRETNYTFRATCGTETQDANFWVSQRNGLENQFFGELFFLKDNGGFFVIAGILTLLFVVAMGSLLYWIIKSWKS